MSHEHRSLFMELPTEVRENILRYLFVASYTTTEQNMRSKEYNAERVKILIGSDQIYQFHTSIMRTNRRIYEESINLFQRENCFVCLTSSRPSIFAEYLSLNGMKMIVSGAKAHRFSSVAMTLTVDLPAPGEWVVGGYRDWGDEQPRKYIFCLDELPTFCRLLLKDLGEYHEGQYLRSTTIHIGIHPTREQQFWEIDRSASGLMRLHKLLNPLRQLHSLGTAQIEGPLSPSYKSSIIEDLCKERPNAIDVIRTTTVMLGQGDKQIGRDLFVDAINNYKTALNHVRSFCWFNDEQRSIMDSGPFPGLTAKQTMRNLEVRLFARIASTYFQNGMFRMARIYVERALNPRHFVDLPYEEMIDLDSSPWHHVVYAEIMHVSAQIWYASGQVCEAVSDLRKAQKYVEPNETQQCTLEAWQRHEDRLSERHAKKSEARKIRLQKANSKTEGEFLVLCNWKKKGDRLLKRGRSDLAISTYQTTLSKMKKLNQKILTQNLDLQITSGTFAGYTLDFGIDALRFKVQAGMAASYLSSRKYRDVINITNDLLRCDGDSFKYRHDYCAEHMHVLEHYTPDWVNIRRDYAKAYYCNSIGLMRIGEIAQAVERMEKALKLDPEDSSVSAQLMILRRKAEKEKS